MRQLCGRSLQRQGLLPIALVVLLLAAALPAKAVPVDVFFDGPTTPLTNFGLSQMQALAVESAFGVPIVQRSFDFVGSTTGLLGITQSIDSFTPIPPTSTDNRASSTWSAENVSGVDLLGASFVLFTSSSPFTANGAIVDYSDENIGLTIDVDLGWVIIQVAGGGQDYFYPAITLDRSAGSPLGGRFLDGQIESWNLRYVINEPLIEAPSGSSQYQLPLWNTGLAFAAVPEPGTGTLVALGLVALAARRRRS